MSDNLILKKCKKTKMKLTEGQEELANEANYRIIQERKKQEEAYIKSDSFIALSNENNKELKLIHK